MEEESLLNNTCRSGHESFKFYLVRGLMMKSFVPSIPGEDELLPEGRKGVPNVSGKTDSSSGCL